MMPFDVINKGLTLASLFGQRALQPQQTNRERVAYALPILFCGAGILFFGLGLEKYLETIYSPDIASFLIGIMMLIIAGFGWAIIWSFERYKISRVVTFEKTLEKSVYMMVDKVGEELKDPVKNHPLISLALATVAGLVVANQILKK